MSQPHMDHEQQQPQPQHHHHHNHHHHHQQDSFEDHTSGWPTTGAYDPQHQSPVQDYNGFSNYAPLPMGPLYTRAMHPPPPQPRTAHPQQPLIMPQWPSVLTSQSTSQSTYVPPILPSAPVPITPASATPVSATSTHSGRTSSTLRKPLTDADRRRMCQYHEDHPTVKQTEIGAMFGVERSTVSKVLRQKEKYLYQDDGSRSPIKRPKGKFPDIGAMFGVERSTVSKVLRQKEKYLYQDDGSRSPIKRPKGKSPDIERALANWARNHQRQGLPLSDAIIREKARFLAITAGNSESNLKANSTTWLEKFKQKNNLMVAKFRKSSIAEELEGTSNPPSNVHSPTGFIDSADSAYVSNRPPSRASSYGSVGSVDSGVSHPPGTGIKRKRVVDMSYFEFAKQAGEEPAGWNPSSYVDYGMYPISGEMSDAPMEYTCRPDIRAPIISIE